MEIVGSGAVAHWGLLVRFMDLMHTEVNAVYYCELTLTDKGGERNSQSCTYYAGKIDPSRVDEFLHANGYEWIGHVLLGGAEGTVSHLKLSPKELLERCENNPINGQPYHIYNCNCQSWVGAMGVQMPPVKFTGLLGTLTSKLSVLGSKVRTALSTAWDVPTHTWGDELIMLRFSTDELSLPPIPLGQRKTSLMKNLEDICFEFLHEAGRLRVEYGKRGSWPKHVRDTDTALMDMRARVRKQPFLDEAKYAEEVNVLKGLPRYAQLGTTREHRQVLNVATRFLQDNFAEKTKEFAEMWEPTGDVTNASTQEQVFDVFKEVLDLQWLVEIEDLVAFLAEEMFSAHFCKVTLPQHDSSCILVPGQSLADKTPQYVKLL